MPNNFKKFVNSLWIWDPFPKIYQRTHEHPTNSLAELKSLGIRNHRNDIFSYLNINSIRNKFDNLKVIIDEHVGILSVAESIIDNSFPTAQFSWRGYHNPYCLDISDRREGLLVFIKSHLLLDAWQIILRRRLFKLDFNMESNSPILISFMQSLNLFDIIKSNTCFKGNGTCINLILKNRKYWFKHSSTFETGLSDHRHLIYSMLKITFKKRGTKTL